MRAGSGHLIAGVTLFAAGTAVTLTSSDRVWYGAIIVGMLEIARGMRDLMRGAR